jgi:hypothetical protein
MLPGPEYERERPDLPVTLVSLVMVVLTLTGTATPSTGHHRRFRLAGSLQRRLPSPSFMPLSLEARCVLSPTIGPAVGMLAHLLALRKLPAFQLTGR